MKKIITAVIDTNVIISSLWGGKPYEIIKLWSSGKIKAAVSSAILSEYIDVLQRFGIPSELLEEFTLLFADTKNTVITDIKKTFGRICIDPADDKFIECAENAHASYIVSGDKHLLKLQNYGRIRIVTPSSFLKDFLSS